jgi:hypothetical protein
MGRLERRPFWGGAAWRCTALWRVKGGLAEPTAGLMSASTNYVLGRFAGPRAVADDHNNRVEVLRLVLTDVERERDRLRDARASWTARLGPLPASAAVVTGLVAAKAGEVDWWWAATAGLLFVVLLAVSVGYSGLKPYRELRHCLQEVLYPEWSKQGFGFRPEEDDVATWLEMKIELEDRICGAPGERRSRLLPTREIESLTHALNAERAAANIVYALSLVIFVVLVVGTAVS